MNKAILIFIILANLLTQSALAASLTSSIDRHRLGENETLNLTIKYDDARVSGQPNLAGLQSHFEILNSRSSSNTQIINGKLSSNKSWLYTLLPKKTGKLIIPSFELKGSYTDAIEVLVVGESNYRTEPGNRGDLFMEAFTDKKQAFVQEMITYTIRIYTSVRITQPKLGELSLPGFMIEPLATSQFEKQYDGKNYYVLEYKYALFANESGDLAIPKKRYQISQIISNGPRSLFNVPGFESTQARFLASPEINLTIKPAPVNRSTDYWLVAEDIQISDNWQGSQTIEQGKPITRKIEITALNSLASHIPPTPDVKQNNLKFYPEAAELDNGRAGEKLRSSRIENAAIVAIEPGTYTLPEINLHWWNSKTKAMQVSTLPTRQLQITASTLPSQQPLLISEAPNTPVNANAIQPKQTDGKAKLEGAINQVQQSNLPWKIAAIIFAGLWIVTLVTLWNKTHRNKTHLGKAKAQLTADSKITGPRARQQLIDACRRHHTAQARELLISWGKSEWPEQSITSLQQIKANTDNAELIQAIDELDNALYGAGEAWRGDKLLSFATQNKKLKKEDAVDMSLPGLYD